MLSNIHTCLTLLLTVSFLAACNPAVKDNKSSPANEPINEATFKDDYLEITDIAAREIPITRPDVIRQYNMEYGQTVFDFFIQKQSSDTPSNDTVIATVTSSKLDSTRISYSINVVRICGGLSNSYKLIFEYDYGDEMSEVFLEEFVKSMFVADCSGEVQKVHGLLLEAEKGTE